MKYRINKIETYISLDFEENTYEEYIKNYKNENNYILDENNIKIFSYIYIVLIIIILHVYQEILNI